MTRFDFRNSRFVPQRRLILAATLVLTGCAANQVRLEYAGTVAAESKKLGDVSKAYIAGVQARRRDSNIALVADNPSCRWSDRIVIDRDWAGPPTGLCDITGVPPDRQVAISLRPVSDDALKGMTAAIAGVAAYQGALAEILDEQPVNAKLALDEAIGQLTTASGDLSRITGLDVNFIPLTDERVGAITTLIGTLVELQQTNLKVQQVRTVLVKHNGAALFETLKSESADVSKVYDAGSASRLLVSLNNAYDTEVKTIDFPTRRERLREIAAANDDVTSGRADRLKALTDAIIKLEKIDKEFREALEGNFTAEKKREIARRNRTMILNILSQVAALFPAA